MNAFFGQPWDAPVCEDAPRAPTPVGHPCLDCGLPIQDGDQGFLIPYVRGPGWVTIEPHHRLCFLLQILGPHITAADLT